MSDAPESDAPESDAPESEPIVTVHGTLKETHDLCVERGRNWAGLRPYRRVSVVERRGALFNASEALNAHYREADNDTMPLGVHICVTPNIANVRNANYVFFQVPLRSEPHAAGSDSSNATMVAYFYLPLVSLMGALAHAVAMANKPGQSVIVTGLGGVTQGEPESDAPEALNEPRNGNAP